MLDDDLDDPPSGGSTKQWLAGVGLAAAPVVYGLLCLERGHTTLVGRRAHEELYGAGGRALAVAYIAVGMFLHFHYFWGLSTKLSRFSQAAKCLALLVFLPSLAYALFHAFS